MARAITVSTLGLRYLGVDEVARAKGYDDLTIVYDRVSGDRVWGTEGAPRTACRILRLANESEAESTPSHAALVYSWRLLRTRV